jgi:hypothetical protein
MSDIINTEIAAITKRVRAAEADYAHARLHDPGHPNTERLRRQIADDKRWLVDLTGQRAQALSADEFNKRNNSVFFGSSN